MENCRGAGTCHGSLDWCDSCGDVDLICDDPECDAHMRIEEVVKERNDVLARIEYLEREIGELQKPIVDFNSILKRMKGPDYQMVSRGRRIDLVAKVMND